MADNTEWIGELGTGLKTIGALWNGTPLGVVLQRFGEGLEAEATVGSVGSTALTPDQIGETAGALLGAAVTDWAVATGAAAFVVFFPELAIPLLVAGLEFPVLGTIGVGVGVAGADYGLGKAGGAIGKWLGKSAGDLFDHPQICPLAIDLDGNGLDLTTLAASSAFFDLDNDGFAEHTAWVTGNDGLLAVDTNGNGQIDNLNELFGDGTGNGFRVLANFDSNFDGVVDQNDRDFGKILVWRDANQDGVSQPGELMTLTQLGIKSISLNATSVSTDIDGNTISAVSSYLTSSGGGGQVFDVSFDNDQRDSELRDYSKVKPTPAAYDVPTLKGYGNVADLRIAMSIDPKLLADMQNLSAERDSFTSFYQFRTKFETVMLRWLGVQDIDPASRGAGVDARHIDGLVKLMGQPYGSDVSHPTNAGAIILDQVWNAVVDQFALRVLVQLADQDTLSTFQDKLVGTLASLMEGASMSDTDLDSAIADAIKSIGSPANDSAFLKSFVDLDWKMDGDSITGNVAQTAQQFFDTAFTTMFHPPADGNTEAFSQKIEGTWGQFFALAESADDSTAATLYDRASALVTAAYDSRTVVLGTSAADTLTGGENTDWLYGLKGNDTLSGKAGNDLYIFVSGDGHDTIYDDGSWDPADQLVLGAGIAPTQMTVREGNSGEDIVLTVGDGSDRITLQHVIDDDRVRIEKVDFATGKVWDYSDLFAKATTPTSGADSFWGDELNNELKGLAGNDHLYGRDGDDILTGGTGDDMLSGNGGNDTYVFALGDGHDRIYDDGSWDPADQIVLGAGIGSASVSVREANSGNDLVLTVGSGGDQITIQNDVSDERVRIESVMFSSGKVWSYATLLANATTATDGNDSFWGDELANTLKGGAGNDHLYGRDGDDVITGGTGDDVLSGNGGNDTYVFALGDGHDRIYDDGSWDTGDTVALGAGIGPGTLTVREANSGNDLILTVDSAGDQITIQNDISEERVRVESVTFASGKVWDYATLFARATVATAGNDAFWGDELANTLNGGAGDDTLNARNGDDVLSGGTGNDHLSGGAGNDTYLFNRGDGHDSIYDDGSWDTGDKIVLGAGIAASDVTVREANSGNDLILTIGTNGDAITLQNVVSDERVRIEDLQFHGGGAWDWTTLLAKATSGTAGNDTYWGDELGDTMKGADGNDTLYGQDGDDDLSGGAGHDVLHGGAGADTLSGGGGKDYFAYDVPWDSSGPGFDTITDFNAQTDKFQFSDTVTGIDAAVSTGALSMSSFDADLAAAINAGKLAAGHAVIFTPDSGDLHGQTFLIVDWNGQAGYQRDGDLVVRLDNATHMADLSTADFITA